MSLTDRKQERDFTAEVKALQPKVEQLASVRPPSSRRAQLTKGPGRQAARCCRDDRHPREANPKCSIASLALRLPR